jgi:transcriptional regulator with XRE-family HTH domain
MTARAVSARTYAEGVRDYLSELTPTVTRADSVRYDWLRTDIDLLAANMLESHEKVRRHELSERTFDKSKKDVASLLAELAYDRGMSWSSIAELAQVSVSAVRKWRTGGAATPEKRGALARIAATLDLLEEKGAVGDPAVWMEMDLPFDEPGYYIRPLDLYMQGHEVALLDIAERRKSVAQVLDEISPGWRQHRSDFEVYTDVDGQRSIHMRGH